MMQASYKYHVGQRFWVPRVNKVSSVETIEVDGREYRREENKYYPKVREKEITEVTINLSKLGSVVSYGIVNIVNTDNLEDWPSYIDEDQINCRTKEEAERDAAEAAAAGRNCYDY